MNGGGAAWGRYMAKQYGTKVKWAIAGRRMAALEKIKAELVGIDAALTDLTIIICDSFDADAITDMVRRTRAVATSVGPFSRFGQLLAERCAAAGTHYTDTTGEGPFVRQCTFQLDQLAHSTGAHIVNLCGFDCLPTEMVLMTAAEKLQQEKGEDLAKAVTHIDARGAVSGGTISTVMNLAATMHLLPRYSVDPLKVVAGAKTPNKVKTGGVSLIGRTKDGRWCVLEAAALGATLSTPSLCILL